MYYATTSCIIQQIEKIYHKKGGNDGAAFIPIVETRGFRLRRGNFGIPAF